MSDKIAIKLVFSAESVRIKLLAILEDGKMTKNKWFGTDGVRGVANVFPMTADFAMRLGMAAGVQVCVAKRRVAIAKDTRISGDMLEAGLIAGFTSQGVDVVRLGVIPTPAVTTLVSGLDVDMAVMITASHNPYQDNGIKLIAADGAKFSDEITAELEKLVEKNEFTFDCGKIGRVSDDFTQAEKYKKIALAAAAPKALSGMKMVIDCANGCFSDILPEVFASLGAEVIAMGCNPDGVNINRDCGSQHTEAMCAKVVEAGAALGVAVDGDGDRIIICDEKGQRLDGDQIIAYLGQYFHASGRLKNNTVVATIVSNPALDRFLAGLGVRCVRSNVGERYVIEEMIKNGANIGGEESGHMVVADYSKTGDAMMAALVVAMGIRESGRKASEIFPLFAAMPRKRIDSKFAAKDQMQEAFENAEFKNAIKQGELKLGERGKVLIRKSGTEPKVQVWVWSDDETLAEEIAGEISAVLQKCPGFEGYKRV